MQGESKAGMGHKRFFIIYFAILILLLTVLGIMRWLGYHLIESGVEYFLFGVLLCSALVALTFFIVKRFDTKWLKILIGCIGIGITFIAAMAMIMVFSVMIEISLPGYYNSFTSPSGKTAVVLRSYSAERVSERIEGEPQGSYEELGFSYEAYPKAAVFFYNSKEPGEGTLEIGCTSAAQLMYEWTDDGTLHLYVDNPENGDGGDYSITLE